MFMERRGNRIAGGGEGRERRGLLRWGKGRRGQEELGNLWGVTYQEVEAVLDLLEAVDVMFLCYLYSKKGVDGESYIMPRLPPLPQTPTPLPWPFALTSLILFIFLPVILLLTTSL